MASADRVLAGAPEEIDDHCQSAPNFDPFARRVLAVAEMGALQKVGRYDE
jgi:hypothetical protein